MLMGLLHVNSVSGPLGRANARRIGDVVPFLHSKELSFMRSIDVKRYMRMFPGQNQNEYRRCPCALPA